MSVPSLVSLLLLPMQSYRCCTHRERENMRGRDGDTENKTRERDRLRKTAKVKGRNKKKWLIKREIKKMHTAAWK